MLVCVILLKYCIYLYIYYVPATKLCNREKMFSQNVEKNIKVILHLQEKASGMGGGPE